jgi:hypothetical protein
VPYLFFGNLYWNKTEEAKQKVGKKMVKGRKKIGGECEEVIKITRRKNRKELKRKR